MPTLSYTPTAVLALGSHTELAVELNAAMAADVMARMDYLLTWGVCWEPLPTPTTHNEHRLAPSTTVHTCR